MISNKLKNNFIPQSKNTEAARRFKEKDIKINDFITPGKKYRFIHINPGFNSEFGHHSIQNQKLEKLIASDGGDFVVLSNNKIDKKLIKNVNIIPTFSYFTWALALDDDNKYYTSFYHELLHVAELINIIDPDTDNIFFMYLADSKHINIIIEIAKSLGNNNNYFILNLFHIYKEFFKKRKQFGTLKYEFYLALASTAQIREKYKISLSVETDILQNEIRDYMNEHLSIMPMFSSMLDEFGGGIKSQKTTKAPLTVYLPSTSADRGYELVYQLILLTKKKKTFPLFKFVLRNQNINDKDIIEILKKISDSSEIIEGILPKERYAQLILDADIVLIPYRKEDFYARTSGVYADAVLAGKPVIATKQTWVGQQVLKHANGVTFSDGDVHDFHNALIKLQENFLEYSQNALVAREDWLKNHNGKTFLQFIKDNSINRIYSTDDTSAAYEWNLVNLQRVVQYKNGVISEITNEKDGVIKERDKTIKRMEEMIRNRDEIIKKQEEIKKRQDVMIKNRDEIVMQKTSVLKEKEVMIKNREEIIKRQEGMIKNRDEQERQKTDFLKEKDGVIKNIDVIVKKHEEMIKRQEQMIKSLDGQLKQKTDVMKEEDGVIKNINVIVKKHGEVINKQEEMSKNLSAQARQKAKLLKEKDNVIKNIDVIIKKQEEMIKRQEEMMKNMEEQIRQKKELLEEKEEMIKDCDEIISEKDKQIQTQSKIIKEKEKFIKQLLESKTYKAGKFIISPILKLKRVLKKG